MPIAVPSGPFGLPHQRLHGLRHAGDLAHELGLLRGAELLSLQPHLDVRHVVADLLHRIQLRPARLRRAHLRRAHLRRAHPGRIFYRLKPLGRRLGNTVGRGGRGRSLLRLVRFLLRILQLLEEFLLFLNHVVERIVRDVTLRVRVVELVLLGVQFGLQLPELGLIRLELSLQSYVHVVDCFQLLGKQVAICTFFCGTLVYCRRQLSLRGVESLLKFAHRLL
mmetsp:Transcript_9287/g.15928  ORF Transcript_9287/g.15928 Transcript_9287/m.15928 type:complete len:222 (+) Transcript_9287:111-776(+)